MLIGHIDVLPALFGQVVIPAGVLSELQHPHTPEAVHHWLANQPAWLTVRAPTNVLRQTNFHIAEKIIQRALKDDADRKAKKRGL